MLQVAVALDDCDRHRARCREVSSARFLFSGFASIDDR
jgi:hypothetical protein